ncbi:MAG: CapA family protein [Candidatus Pacebacteria bacterium]|nr:CapA family protein [Candidatus Paceibacterota bacterium]
MGRLYHILGIGIIGTAAIVMLILIINKKNIYLETYTNFATANLADVTVKAKPKNAKILILGDMMFDRTVRSKINTYGFEYVFGPATTTFANYDLVVANLEGPISTHKSKTILDNNKSISGFQFTFATGTARALKNAGIDVVSLANNHTDNFGQDGLNQTRQFLDNEGIQYFGSPQNNTAIATSTCIAMSATGTSKDSASKLCIGFIGWHEFGSKNHQNILNEIAALRPKVDYLIVFPHWGEEYKKTPHIEQVRLARVWTDAGADAVIGAHPHVVQQIVRRTTTDGRVVPIFYSLGNFIFDQYFSFDTTHGIAVEIEFRATSTAVTESASISSSTKSIAQSAMYKIIPFSSVGTKVSIPNATSTARIFGDIEKVSGTGVWGWLKK